MATAYTQDELRSLFQSSFNLKQWYSFLQYFFSASELKEKPERIIKDTTDEGYYLGNIDTKDHYHIGFFCYNIRKGSVANKRVGLRNLVKSFINPTWGIFDAALVVFDSGDHWRLSFISDIKGDATSPKRYTYVFGSNELLYKTPIERFRFLQDKGISFENLKTAFSVEALSDEFFDKYREQYADFIQYVTGKRFVKVGNKWVEKLLGEPDAALMQAFNYNEKKIRDYVKKMMGRITFLHFLQRKRWMCGDLNYMQNLFENSKYKDDYLDSVLEPLFFGILNTKPANREALFIEYGWDKALLEEWKDIPYLNGGLFERDEDDEPESKFPADYFKRLFQFFSEYNFTIDENDPNDSEVGIDPEMLGHIFENLLEDNKDKGAFYTPKEIVHYMCRQSVIQYLKTHEPDEQYAEPIEQLINNGIVMPILQTQDVASRFMKLLKEVKVCDPAIGSGAFPMGILYVLYYAIHNLQPHAEPKGSFDSTETKREIIQNNIFGVDIEQGAVDIARLRFWLALVVDAEEPQPLPNLDYKITCGNSLLSRYPIDAPIENVFVEYNKGKEENEKMTLAKYKDMVNEYTNTSNHQIKKHFRETIKEIKQVFKTELSNQFRERLAKLRGKVVMLESPNLFGERTKVERAELKKLKDKLNMLEKEQEDIRTNKLYLNAFEWRFEFPQLLDENGLFTGFDITIGNPPYNELRDIDLSMQNALKLSRYYDYAKGGRLNMFQFFYPLAINIAKDNGIVSMITQNSILAEDSALGNRKLFFSQTDILEVDSFPERDNKNLRVFESVKMSVCICILRKNNKPNKSSIIPINVWHSRFMHDKHKLNISMAEIMDMYPEDLIIPISSNDNFSILKGIKSKGQYQISASTGEIDMTKYKNIFNKLGVGTRVLTGAQIQRYYITENPSQGDVIYIDDWHKPKLSKKRELEISNSRIVLQRITGVDSKIRIIATLVDDYVYCANSTNYIPNDKFVNIKYLLGVLNSSLVNFFIKQTSTNTNITAKVLNSIPIIIPSINMQEAIVRIVDYILMIKSLSSNIIIDQYVDNDVIVRQFEKIIDALVYELYFHDDFIKADISFTDSVLRDFKSINTDRNSSIQTIQDAFAKLRSMDNGIRNNLKYMSVKLEYLLAPIINI